MEGKGTGRVATPPILKKERKEEQWDSPLGVTGIFGSPAVKPPPCTRGPEGGGGETGVGHNPEVHSEKGVNISQVTSMEEEHSWRVGSSSEESTDEGEGALRGPPVARGSVGFHLGFGSSGEESSEEGEDTLVGPDMEEVMGKKQCRTRKGSQWKNRAHMMRGGQAKPKLRGRKMK